MKETFLIPKSNCVFSTLSLSEFIQPQNLWPYIQQNLIQQNHLTNPAFIANHHHHQHHHLQQQSNSHANGSESNVLACNNNNNNNNISNGSSSPEHQTSDSRDNKVIAKPLPSRPFMHHGINHPHLHSLLAHCRNPYIAGMQSCISCVN